MCLDDLEHRDLAPKGWRYLAGRGDWVLCVCVCVREREIPAQRQKRIETTERERVLSREKVCWQFGLVSSAFALCV